MRKVHIYKCMFFAKVKSISIPKLIKIGPVVSAGECNEHFIMSKDKKRLHSFVYLFNTHLLVANSNKFTSFCPCAKANGLLTPY